MTIRWDFKLIHLNIYATAKSMGISARQIYFNIFASEILRKFEFYNKAIGILLNKVIYN